MFVNSLKHAPLSSYELSWCGMGLPIVCGLFKVDKNESKIIVPAMLSHIVCSYASEHVLIHPREHEVWAVYRDLDPLIWCLEPEARKASKLVVVEIITGYTESRSMLVARLVKVDGLGNVFRRQTEKDHEHIGLLEETWTACLSLILMQFLQEYFVGDKR